MNQRPVIAVVCDAIYPYSHGGREIRYQELLPRLAEHAEVHVYTMHWWDGPRVYSDAGVTYHAISQLLPMYTNNRRSLWQALRFGLASLHLLRCYFDVLEADHIPYLQVFVLRIVATLKRKPLSVTWHEAWSLSYWREYLGWIGWAAWSIEWLAMRLPDRIIAASPQTAERLRQTLGERTSITIVPNGIDLNTIRSACSDSAPSDLVVVGRLLDHKRIDMLLDVVALLHTRGMHVTCRIIGNGPERMALEDRARALHIPHAVEFRDDVCEQKDLYSLVKAARVFVSLSLREGFGMAVLEAIACGIPVLTTSAPDNLSQHLVARYSRGVVCDPAPDAVAAAVQELLVQANGSRRYVYGTDSWVAEYDWSAMTDVWWACISSEIPGASIHPPIGTAPVPTSPSRD
jgi:glycosyltransferase involved in cell wall biosynthesis